MEQRAEGAAGAARLMLPRTLILTPTLTPTPTPAPTPKGSRDLASGPHWRGLARILLRKGLLRERGRPSTCKVCAVSQPGVTPAGRFYLAEFNAGRRAIMEVELTCDMLQDTPPRRTRESRGGGRGKGASRDVGEATRLLKPRTKMRRKKKRRRRPRSGGDGGGAAAKRNRGGQLRLVRG